MAFSLQNYSDLGYTRHTIIKHLLLIQNHSVDGSSLVSKCSCVEGKHLIAIEGLSEEGATIATNQKEKKFYANLADWARNLRKNIESEHFIMPQCGTHTHLTKCERDRERCIKKVSRSNPNLDAVSICQARIKCA